MNPRPLDPYTRYLHYNHKAIYAKEYARESEVEGLERRRGVGEDDNDDEEEDGGDDK